MELMDRNTRLRTLSPRGVMRKGFAGAGLVWLTRVRCRHTKYLVATEGLRDSDGSERHSTRGWGDQMDRERPGSARPPRGPNLAFQGALSGAKLGSYGLEIDLVFFANYAEWISAPIASKRDDCARDA